MPPSRAKLHNKTGKLKTIKPIAGEPESTETSFATSTSRDSEVDRQFEVELCWCIQQLETHLTSGKLNQKQSLETEKILRILKSGKQPIIKKRQLMRTTFGDYRVKMAEEEKKMSLVARQIKFAENVPDKKSHFVKKATSMSSNKKSQINFVVENIKHLDISENNIMHTEVNQQKEHEDDATLLISPPGNTFKFNFDITTEES